MVYETEQERNEAKNDENIKYYEVLEEDIKRKNNDPSQRYAWGFDNYEEAKAKYDELNVDDMYKYNARTERHYRKEYYKEISIWGPTEYSEFECIDSKTAGENDDGDEED